MQEIDATFKHNALERERRIRAALIDAPDCRHANIALARIMEQSNRASAATVHWRHVIALDKNTTPEADKTLGHNARMRVALEASTAHYSSAVVKAANDPGAWAGLINALEASGDFDATDDAIERAKSHLGGVVIGIRREIGMAYLAMKRYEAALAVWQDTASLRPIEWLDVGRAWDRVGEHERAWAAWMHGKQLLHERAGHTFQREAFDTLIADLTEMTTPRRWSRVRPATRLRAGALAPIFVAGFPRSGTTLFEQALGAHAKIIAGDELPFVHELAGATPAVLGVPVDYPFSLAADWYGDNVGCANVLRDWYMAKAVERIGRPKQAARYFTDKLPINELHGLFINYMFPASIIFVLQRDPRDCMVSNMSNYLTHTFYNQASLESCAYAYARIYEYRQRVGDLLAASMVTVNYEAFVRDHVNALHEHFARLRLKWDTAAAAFHLNPRRSRTISYQQIREPVNDSSIGRWHAYERHLAPVFDVLAPVLKGEGYE